LKILTVVYNLDKGGTQRAAQVFAEAYKELRHDSRVLSLYGVGVRYDEIKDKIKVWNGASHNNLTEIKNWEPNVIHIHSHGPKDQDINALLSSVENVKIIETNVFSTPSIWADKVDVSLQLSHWANWLFKLRGGGKFKSAIVPYAVKCHSFQKARADRVEVFRKEQKIPKDAFVIGRVGQSFAGKWSPMLLSVFNDLASKEERLYLLLINAPNNILSLMDESPYKNRIRYVSKVIGDENLSTVYSSMNVMLLIAEQGESFGMVLAESILCETPVVTLSTPWADNSQGEVVKHLAGGYVANTERGIKESILMLMNGKSRLNMKDVGTRHIRTNYDYLHVANQALRSLNKEYVDDDYIDRLSLLKNAIDKPNIITLLFLQAGSDILRRLTIFSSNYNPWYDLVVIVFKKIVKR
jgi:glycosyltransferase involved in cell wall biosynthesis